MAFISDNMAMVKSSSAAGSNRSPKPDPVDIHVGARLRLRRTMTGLSQEQLGKATGLTFQQIQKYERGTNRMAASRLFQLSRLLDVPVSYFFEDMPSATLAMAHGPGMAENAQQPLEGVTQGETELFRRRETLGVIRAYYLITDPKQRRKIYELIKTMAEQAA